MTKWVYTFGDGKAEGKAEMRNLLGGKGANLAEMSNLGLPVPPGLTITTEVCTYYYANKESYPPELKEQVSTALREIGYQAKGNFGDPDKPLLLSVRSGARVSMPGMMDTVLNLGLNAQTTEGMAKMTGDERFAYDSYRRFIQMYSDVVLGVDHALFEEILDDEKDQKGAELDTDLDAGDLKRIAALYKARVEKELGKPFPEDVQEQLWGAIGAVFGSWHSPRVPPFWPTAHPWASVPTPYPDNPAGTPGERHARRKSRKTHGNRREPAAGGGRVGRGSESGRQVQYRRQPGRP